MDKSEEKEDSFWGKYKYLIIAFFLSIVVIVLWYNSYIWFFDNAATITEKGSYGDSFGLINSLFSGLAFVGIIVTIWMQSAELKLQRDELRDTRNVFINQEKVMKNQLKIQSKQLDIQQRELDRLIEYDLTQKKPSIFINRSGYEFGYPKSKKAELSIYSTDYSFRVLAINIIGKDSDYIELQYDNIGNWIRPKFEPEFNSTFKFQLSRNQPSESGYLRFEIGLLFQDLNGCNYMSIIAPKSIDGYSIIKQNADINISETQLSSDFLFLEKIENHLNYLSRLSDFGKNISIP